jgi:hypothetical protein
MLAWQIRWQVETVVSLAWMAVVSTLGMARKENGLLTVRHHRGFHSSSHMLQLRSKSLVVGHMLVLGEQQSPFSMVWQGLVVAGYRGSSLHIIVDDTTEFEREFVSRLVLMLPSSDIGLHTWREDRLDTQMVVAMLLVRYLAW